MPRETTLPLLVLGPPAPTGDYVLRIEVAAPLDIAFGHFRRGAPVAVPAGLYAYVGSAHGRGATALAPRLLRHATRAGGRPPHAIRPALRDALVTARIADEHVAPPAAKTPRWHADYLLQAEEATLVQALVWPGEARREAALAARLEANPRATPLAPGLGASDARGATHLWRVVDAAGFAALAASGPAVR